MSVYQNQGVHVTNYSNVFTNYPMKPLYPRKLMNLYETERKTLTIFQAADRAKIMLLGQYLIEAAQSCAPSLTLKQDGKLERMVACDQAHVHLIDVVSQFVPQMF